MRPRSGMRMTTTSSTSKSAASLPARLASPQSASDVPDRRFGVRAPHALPRTAVADAGPDPGAAHADPRAALADAGADAAPAGSRSGADLAAISPNASRGG